VGLAIPFWEHLSKLKIILSHVETWVYWQHISDYSSHIVVPFIGWHPGQLPVWPLGEGLGTPYHKNPECTEYYVGPQLFTDFVEWPKKMKMAEVLNMECQEFLYIKLFENCCKIISIEWVQFSRNRGGKLRRGCGTELGKCCLFYLMFCWPCIIIYQYSRTNKMHFLYSVYYELTASTCFEPFFLIVRRRCRNVNWYCEGGNYC
jgi:hypothetical protein